MPLVTWCFRAASARRCSGLSWRYAPRGHMTRGPPRAPPRPPRPRRARHPPTHPPTHPPRMGPESSRVASLASGWPGPGMVPSPRDPTQWLVACASEAPPPKRPSHRARFAREHRAMWALPGECTYIRATPGILQPPSPAPRTLAYAQQVACRPLAGGLPASMTVAAPNCRCRCGACAQ